jgi:hypothetical protein
MTFDWRAGGPEAAERAYYAWRSTRGLRVSQDEDDRLERGGFVAGFAAGARWCVITTGHLAPSIASLAEFLRWLQEQSEGSQQEVGL